MGVMSDLDIDRQRIEAIKRGEPQRPCKDWQVVREGELLHVKSDDFYVASVHSGAEPWEEMEENALLIANAPRLRKALLRLVAAVELAKEDTSALLEAYRVLDATKKT